MWLFCSRQSHAPPLSILQKRQLEERDTRIREQERKIMDQGLEIRTMREYIDSLVVRVGGVLRSYSARTSITKP